MTEAATESAGEDANLCDDVATSIEPPALLGLRFVAAVWAVQRHVGLFPESVQRWSIVRDVSASLLIFTILAGFLMAVSSGLRPLRTADRHKYLVRHIAKLHALYLATYIFAVPAFFLRLVSYMDSYDLWLGFSVVLSFAFAPITAIDVACMNEPAWYMLTLYICVALSFVPSTLGYAQCR